MFKIMRFLIRGIFLLIAIVLGIICIDFFLSFRSLSVDQLYDTFAVVSSKPLISLILGAGILLFVLSLLGLVMLLTYPIGRYPLSIFVGYVVGVLIYYQFYLLHPFQANILQLNNTIWYYPLIIATLLLLRAIMGLMRPIRKTSVKSNENVTELE